VGSTLTDKAEDVVRTGGGGRIARLLGEREGLQRERAGPRRVSLTPGNTTAVGL
jgi:hypothetical protein